MPTGTEEVLSPDGARSPLVPSDLDVVLSRVLLGVDELTDGTYEVEPAVR